MREKSLTVISGALTATTRSAVSQLAIPEGSNKVMTLTKVKVVNFPTMETIVNSGGLVEIECKSKDISPFGFYTNTISCITEGGGKIKPTIVNCNKPLVSGSNLDFYFTPYDNQSQKFAVTIYYEDKAFGGKQTYALHDLGTAITQVTIDTSHLTWKIPNGKAGNLLGLQVMALGTLETVVNQGGLCGFTEKAGIGINGVRDFYLEGLTAVDAGGACLEPAFESLVGYLAKDGATINLDYTPQDNQSQRLCGSVFWEA